MFKAELIGKLNYKWQTQENYNKNIQYEKCIKSK